MNKKGNMVAGFFLLVLAVILIAYTTLPMLKQTTTSQPYTETLVKTSENGTAETETLTKDDLETGSVTITGLTVNSNYTVNYTAATIRFTANTTNNSYTAYYNYYAPGYLEDSGDRSLMAVGVLACIIGLLVVVFEITGVTGKR